MTINRFLLRALLAKRFCKILNGRKSEVIVLGVLIRSIIKFVFARYHKNYEIYDLTILTKEVILLTLFRRAALVKDPTK